MPSDLPFQALRVFLEVVRMGGFRPAAELLHVTPGALSRQVAALEAHLGCVLLQRHAGRPPELTREGRRLLQRTQAPMDSLVHSLASFSGPRPRRSVIINTSVTLAMHWLIPQVPRIEQECNGLQLEIQTDDGPADSRLPVDLFIRRDPAELAPLASHPFMDEQAAWVIAPRLWSPGSGAPASLTRLLRRWPRVAARSRPDLWPAWCRHHGLDESTLPAPLWMDNTVLAIQAVLQGLGSGVLPLPFVGEMLKSHSLHRLPADAAPSGSYACAVRPGRDSARVRAVLDWLKRSGR